MKTFNLGTRVIVSSRRCGDFGKIGRVVGIKKDHDAPIQRVYVRFDGENKASVFSARMLKQIEAKNSVELNNISDSDALTLRAWQRTYENVHNLER